MYDMFDPAQLHRDELDREIETIRTERLLQAASPPRPGISSRARAGIGRGLISLGMSLVGTGDSPAVARSAGGGGRA